MTPPAPGSKEWTAEIIRALQMLLARVRFHDPGTSSDLMQELDACRSGIIRAGVDMAPTTLEARLHHKRDDLAHTALHLRRMGDATKIADKRNHLYLAAKVIDDALLQDVKGIEP